ncbi:MAG: methyltransferase [Bernardetiaceae bacterium]|nr:methyltransferase [Bernardetiaceae bacterium]
MSEVSEQQQAIAAAAKEIISTNPYGIMDFRGQEIIILPKVFPADCTTPFLSERMSEIARDIVKQNGSCKALEMGAGSGAAILTVAKEKGVEAHASDINPMSSLCVQANAMFWGVDCQVYNGSVFEAIPEQKFDLIFWNIPFIPHDPGGVEAVEFRAGFDPGYKFQRNFLETVPRYLSSEGRLFLGADREMCDLDELFGLIENCGFSHSIYKENPESWRGFDFTYLIIELKQK